MNRASVELAAIVLALGTSCGSGSVSGGASEEAGNLRVALYGAALGDFATIAIQNVFDTRESYLVDCARKTHTLQGHAFCDELVVLPPGTYQIVVQSPDESCSAEQDHYKVIVRPGLTTEIEVKLLCGLDNGALDTIVVASYRPVIEDIDFWFGCHDRANKFVCADGPNVTVSAVVSDVDTPCSSLRAKWIASSPDLVLQNQVQPHRVNGQCVAKVTIDSSSSCVGDYQLTLKVSDDGYADRTKTSLTLPIHVVRCADSPCR